MAQVTSINQAPEPNKTKKPNGTKKVRPTKVIPTERIKIEKQFDLLRAFVAASGPTGKPVNNKDAAAILNMADTTVSLANNFFVEMGLLTKTGNGFMPSAEVIGYAQAYDWNPDTAAYKLAPLLSKAWFFEAIAPKLKFSTAGMDEDDVIKLLAEASAAAPAYRANLKVIVDFMETTGLVQREGGMVRLARAVPTTSPSPERPMEGTAPDTREQPTPRASVVTAFSQPTEGVVRFHVSVNVEMAEFANWSPDRISAFFNGVAAVLAAKADIEREAGSDK